MALMDVLFEKSVICKTLWIRLRPAEAPRSRHCLWTCPALWSKNETKTKMVGSPIFDHLAKHMRGAYIRHFCKIVLFVRMRSQRFSNTGAGSRCIRFTARAAKGISSDSLGSLMLLILSMIPSSRVIQTLVGRFELSISWSLGANLSRNYRRVNRWRPLLWNSCSKQQNSEEANEYRIH